MAWAYTRFEDTLSIEDFHNGNAVFSIFHAPINLEDEEKEIKEKAPEFDLGISSNFNLREFKPESFFYLGDIAKGVTSLSKEEVERYAHEKSVYPFEGMDKEFSMGAGTEFNPNDYDLELNRRSGLIRRIWTKVPVGERLTHAIYKIAGRGNASDYKTFANFVSERLPKIISEVRAPNLVEIGINKKSLAYAQEVDWERFQREVSGDFYELFSKSVAYQFACVNSPFNLEAKDAKEIMNLVERLRHRK